MWWNEKFQNVIRLLERKYPFGAKKMTSFTFTGIEVNQDPVITSHSVNPITFAKLIPFPSKLTANHSLKLPVNENERGLLRGLVGSLQYAFYLSTNTRPDLSNRLSNLQSQITVQKSKLSMKPIAFFMKQNDIMTRPSQSSPYPTKIFGSWCFPMPHLRPVQNPILMPVA